jgi:hypothetical protein
MVHNNPLLKRVFKRFMAELLMIRGNLPTQREKPAKVSGKLPSDQGHDRLNPSEHLGSRDTLSGDWI